MNIIQKIKNLIFEEMDEDKRKQFIRGFRDGYSDLHHSGNENEWYKIGVVQGRVARCSGMTAGKIDLSDMEI